jgi:glycosyltransferase involved in cell wall biosynthesis
LLFELYESADIFLFPSRETNDSTEGFGIVLIEAMAQGVAILASQVGGIAKY